MKKLKLKSLKVISTKTEEAKIIEFGDRITVFTSEGLSNSDEVKNHTGKSLITKSIYFGLGAELIKYTETWTDLKISTIIDFEYNNINYTLFRQGRYFVLRNNLSNEHNFFASIEELKNYYKDFFDIKLKLFHKTESKSVSPYPQALFLPFYIDQDKGWNSDWVSFTSLSQYKEYLKPIFEFYTGVKTNDYYSLLSKKDILEQEKSKLRDKKNTYQTVIDENIDNFKDALSLNVDIKDFQKDIGALIIELNKIQNKKEKLKENLVKLNNQKSEIILSIKNNTNILKDLEEDEKYIKTHANNDSIQCPICATMHSNNSAIKYIFNLDIENCQKDVNDLIKARNTKTKDIEKIELDMKVLCKKEKQINSLLNRKKKTIKLRDVLVSQGIHEIIKDFQKKQSNCDKVIGEKDADTKQIDSELKIYEQKQKEANDEFIKIMKKFIIKLGITDIEPKKIGEKNQAGGSDLPLGMLAYTLAYYKMLYKNKDAIVMPLVLDTIVQQDPSPTNILKMFNLLIEELPSDCQLILSTTNLYNIDFKTEPYRFTNKRKVLEKDDYEMVKDEYFNFLKLIRKASFK